MQNSRLKHTIIVGNEIEIDNCTYFKDITTSANSISIVNLNTAVSDPKLIYAPAIKENTDVVLVYTNNLEADYYAFIQFALRDLSIMMRRIHFVFLARTTPFKLLTYIRSHFTILIASRSLNNTVKPNPNRLKAKILNIQDSIQCLNTSSSYNQDEKQLFNNYYKKELLNKEVELYNL